MPIIKIMLCLVTVNKCFKKKKLNLLLLKMQTGTSALKMIIFCPPSKKLHRKCYFLCNTRDLPVTLAWKYINVFIPVNDHMFVKRIAEDWSILTIWKYMNVNILVRFRLSATYVARNMSARVVCDRMNALILGYVHLSARYVEKYLEVNLIFNRMNLFNVHTSRKTYSRVTCWMKFR